MRPFLREKIWRESELPTADEGFENGAIQLLRIAFRRH